MSENPIPAGYRFADLELDLVRRRVSRKGAELTLGRLTFELLRTLAEVAPRVVSKEELAERVWRGRFVSKATIKQRIIMLREVLGDSADDPVYLRVVRGQGVALIPEPVPLYDSPSQPVLQRGRTMALAAAVLLFVAVAAFVLVSYQFIGPVDPAATVRIAGSMAEVADPDAWAARVEEAVPDGVELDEVRIEDDGLMLAGEAESATRVSALMRNIAGNALGQPALQLLEYESAEAKGRFVLKVQPPAE